MFRSSTLNLGELEVAILELLWEQGPSTPNDVHRQLPIPPERSVNTIASALKRLHDKGFLLRKKRSHAYLYEAKADRHELQKQILDVVAQDFGKNGEGALLSAFLDFAEARGTDTLRKLESMISDRLDIEKSSQ